MTIPIERETELKLEFDEEALIRKVAEAALEAEKCPYEAEVDDYVLHAEFGAVAGGTGRLAGVVVAAVVEGYGQCYTVALVVEQGRGVQPARQHNGRILCRCCFFRHSLVLLKGVSS